MDKIRFNFMSPVPVTSLVFIDWSADIKISGRMRRTRKHCLLGVWPDSARKNALPCRNPAGHNSLPQVMVDGRLEISRCAAARDVPAEHLVSDHGIEILMVGAAEGDSGNASERRSSLFRAADNFRHPSLPVANLNP